jgi:hypothetical protein
VLILAEKFESHKTDKNAGSHACTWEDGSSKMRGIIRLELLGQKELANITLFYVE